VQPAAWQVPAVHTPSLQSAAALQRCVSAHGAQLPPQSRSDSPSSVWESWQWGNVAPASPELENENPGVVQDAMQSAHAHTKATTPATRTSFDSNIAAEPTALRAHAPRIYLSA
jgi:hypothetical protein